MDERLKEKVGVLCKQYYVLASIDHLFLTAGAEKSWWIQPSTHRYSERESRVYGWLEGIEHHAGGGATEIYVRAIEELLDNRQISENEKRALVRVAIRHGGAVERLPFILPDFHPKVQQLAGSLIHNRHYREAVRETYIGLVQAVKDTAGLNDLDNTPLMQRVFSRDKPILRVSESHDEQLGFMWLFSGAVMAIRNRLVHPPIAQVEPQEALEWLGFASGLFRVLDRARRVDS